MCVHACKSVVGHKSKPGKSGALVALKHIIFKNRMIPTKRHCSISSILVSMSDAIVFLIPLVPVVAAAVHPPRSSVFWIGTFSLFKRQTALLPPHWLFALMPGAHWLPTVSRAARQKAPVLPLVMGRLYSVQPMQTSKNNQE